jgi:hypothetical protein
VYRVRPVGDLEPDPELLDSEPGISWRAGSALVLDPVPLSLTENWALVEMRRTVRASLSNPAGVKEASENALTTHGAECSSFWLGEWRRYFLGARLGFRDPGT